ncbi:MAG: hypothetical protein ACK4F8_01700 [Aquabacterium sp.]
MTKSQTQGAEAITTEQLMCCSNQETIIHTKVETTFLALFGKTELFEGVGLALREIVECLFAAHQLFGLSRLELWATQGVTFGKRIEQLESANRPGLGLPSTAVRDLVSGDLLSNLRDPSLDADALLRVKAMLGLCAVRHLSNGTALPKHVVSSYESLLACQGPRTRQHQDWRELSECQKLNSEALKSLRSKLSSQIVRDFLDELLIVLSSAVDMPVSDPTQTNTTDTINSEDGEEDTDDEDDPNGIFRQQIEGAVQGAGQEAMNVADNILGSVERINEGGDKSTHANHSLIGWRVIDAKRAPFTRRLGITNSWSVLPLEDLQAVCRKLKHAFDTGGVTTRNFVFLAYQSQQWSLPPHLALTVPLDRSAPTHYDVKAGSRSWAYAQLIGKDTAAEPESRAEQLPCTLIQFEIDPDLAEHGRDQLSKNPMASTIGDLVQAGTSPAEIKVFLREYRKFLRSMGDMVHPVYAGRFARSLGPTVKHITGSDILAVFMASDPSMAASGMLHYVTLTAGLLSTWNKKIHAQLGWRPPVGLPDISDETVGAGIGLQAELYALGWSNLQKDVEKASAELATANSLSAIATAWTDLARARLLSFGCITGHRLTRIGRLTADALFGCKNYICISDKVTSRYDSYRLQPVTTRIEQLRESMLVDLDLLRQAIDREDPDGVNTAVVSAAPAKSIFFGLKIVQRNGVARFKRETLDAAALDELSQKHFNRNCNIGRHTLVSMLAEAGVDPWVIRALTGHSATLAEVFGDAAAVPARDLLDQLKHALDQCLEDCRFNPFRAHGNKPISIKFTCQRGIPKPDGDPYVRPSIYTDGHLLPPPADRFSTVSLAVLDKCRARLLVLAKEESDLQPWVDWLLCAMAFDGLHSADLCEIFSELPVSLAGLGSTVIATWHREGRSNLFAVPLSPPTLAALSRCSIANKPKWSTLVTEAGRWLKESFPDLAWPKVPAEALLAFVAMAGRWQRVHVSPAAHAASLLSVMSSTFSAHSLLRLARPSDNSPPAELLANTRLIRPPSGRVTSIKTRPAISEIGTVLFRYQKTMGERHGESYARAKKVLEALATHDACEDLPAMAALQVVRKEMHLILDHNKDLLDVGSLATYWTEVELSLSLVPVCEDIRSWCAADFTAWVEMAIAAIKADAHRKAKKGGAEFNGFLRFLRTGRLLGWEIPFGLIQGKDIYEQDGMRLSAASTLVLADDFESARPIVRHALSEYPLAQERADLLIDFFKSAPCRVAELSTLLAQCVTPGSHKLCVQPAGHSAMKNALAPRLVCIPEYVADRILGTDGTSDEINALGEFLFLDDKGNDWGMLRSILSAIHQAMLLVTQDIHFRFHASRGSAACRLAYPSWESWSRSLLKGTSGADFGGQPLGIPRDAVAQAIAALGHGRTKTFLGYYMPIWPWVKAHELRLTLRHVTVPPTFEYALFGSTDARRAASSRARKKAQHFDIWDWIGHQMVDRLAAPPLLDEQAPVVIVPEELEGGETPAFRALVRYGVMRLVEVSAAEAGHKCGVNGTYADLVDKALNRLAPSFEPVWKRRGQSRGQRGKETDKRLAIGEVGDAFVEQFAQLNIEQLTLLKVCLDVNRGALLLLPNSQAAHLQRIQELSKAMPRGFARLLVREAANAPIEPNPELVELLKDTVVFGDPERDVGQHPLYQVEPVELAAKQTPNHSQHNRKRTGPFTGLARAACIAALAAYNALNEVI